MGATDVSELMASLTPEQFDSWWAASLTGKLDDGWAQAAMVCAVVVNALREIAAGFAGSKLSESDMVTPDMYMPSLNKEEETQPAKEDDSVRNFGALLAAKYGAMQ